MENRVRALEMTPPFDVANFSDTKRLITLLAAFSRWMPLEPFSPFHSTWFQLWAGALFHEWRVPLCARLSAT